MTQPRQDRCSRGRSIERQAANGASRLAFTLLEFLVAFGILSLLIGLLLAALQNSRVAAARLDCQNRVHQLALALHHYHDSSARFPPGHRSDLQSEHMPYSGWTISSLPFLEQSSLAQEAAAAYVASQNPFVNPPHTGLDTVVRAFTCPSDPRVSSAQVARITGIHVAFTSYLGVAGWDAVETRNGIFFQDSSIRIADIADGTSNTLLLGERPPSLNYQFGWWYAGIGQRYTGSADLVLGVREPNVLSAASGVPCSPGQYSFYPSSFIEPCGMFHFWSPHPGGANFAFADGSVHFLQYSANSIMPALASRAGGEAVSSPN